MTRTVSGFLGMQMLFLFYPILFFGCAREQPMPRPYAYHRLYLPDTISTDTRLKCPFQISINQAAMLSYPKGKSGTACWVDLHYPSIHASVHFTYVPLQNRDHLGDCIKGSQDLVFKHTIRASEILEDPLMIEDRKVYGLFYRLSGHSASNSQFYVTDSTHHFLRAALYFDATPHPDSMAPVVDFMLGEMERLASGVRWSDPAKL
jgi:gliding motility-associated lipoprotein GldD